jgi:hypothetical protein
LILRGERSLHADELLTAFLELEAAIRACGNLSCQACRFSPNSRR